MSSPDSHQPLGTKIAHWGIEALGVICIIEGLTMHVLDSRSLPQCQFPPPISIKLRLEEGEDLLELRHEERQQLIAEVTSRPRVAWQALDIDDAPDSFGLDGADGDRTERRLW